MIGIYYERPQIGAIGKDGFMNKTGIKINKKFK